MRPHDLVILLKIVAKSTSHWFNKDIAHELGISQSEVSESLNRSQIAGLITENKKMIMRSALFEFIRYGVKYVYPQKPGAVVRGIPTAYSARPLSEFLQSEDICVWPWALGDQKGQAIEPLHEKVPEACLKDPKLYEMLSLVDAIRIGKVREQKIAIEELEKRIYEK